jgi:hypothetical protein
MVMEHVKISVRQTNMSETNAINADPKISM